ncbi:hypothetical protein [uncultured Rikenella sp.]|uniref:hypothetical protein n=1 Tax=uncultured Rikenella sp. TaxID=368003 RepID=UPI0025E527B1|nr:hypothetical protein [uncultured Rikenella sp.]
MPLGINGNSPAPGYRGAGSGVSDGVGNYGYSWSSAVSGTYGVFLYFYTQYLSPSYAHTRAYGRQLRCLSE